MLTSGDIWTRDAKKNLTPPARNAEAVRDALASLSPDGLRRLGIYASYRMKPIAANARGRSGEDLLGEAITATLRGERVWREGVDFFTHLVGCMRSIAFNWSRKGQEEVLVQENEADLFDNIASESPDPERILSATQQLDGIKSIFAADSVASRTVELLAFGFTGREIRELLGLSEMQYAAAIRRIRRKISRQSSPRPRGTDYSKQGLTAEAHSARSRK